eukprot:CAMPEP_0119127396 /NCGR_PEP_ID=MMETSP1310-20130426/5963_1 /TAXON_ID=464262 /ORGANISM="Genus nov. species nov., Strain RCC2339" /LENGTH=538 /DNA_ID=CAMNT_0007117651 /DNA_START=25 /DNA_END=1641 /DNA_ORIENTATION=-
MGESGVKGAKEKAPAGSSAVYVPAVDGMRGIGVLLVMGYHLGWTFLTAAWINISFFFIISGVLVTRLTVRVLERKGRVDVPTFWSRRAARLLPAAFVCTTGITVWLLLRRLGVLDDPFDERELGYARGDLLCAVGYCENFHLISRGDDYFSQFQKPSPVRHFWSLAIEEQYYVVWPVLFFLWTSILFPVMISGDKQVEDPERGAAPGANVNQGRLRFALSALLFGELLVITASYLSARITYETVSPTAAYLSTWSRCQEFALGGLAFLLFRLHPFWWPCLEGTPPRPLSTAERCVLEFGPFFVLSCLFSSVLPFSFSGLMDYYFGWRKVVVFFTIGGSIVATMVQSACKPIPSWAVFTRFLSFSPLVTAGIISYSAYLWHWPIIMWVKGVDTGNEFAVNVVDGADNELGGNNLQEERHQFFQTTSVIQDALIITGTLSLSLASTYLMERPIQVYCSSQRPRNVILACAAASVVLAVAILLVTMPQAEDDTKGDHNELAELTGEVTGLKIALDNMREDFEGRMALMRLRQDALEQLIEH